MIGRASRSAAALAACALALGACQSLKAPTPGPTAAAPPHLAVPPLAAPPPAVVTVVAPAKSCIPKALSRAPKYPDTDAALRDAGGAADRYQLMAAGRILRERRLAELEKVVEGCR